MIYLSGHVCSWRHPALGFILTPDMGNRVPFDAPVAADNACYSNPRGYSDERYLARLEQFDRENCLFAVAPDVVGDHRATIKRAGPMLKEIRKAGFKVAFCAQDGWDERSTPWDDFDVLFVGGTTAFKFRGGRDAVFASRRRGKRAHMGRVNSYERLRAARAIGCHSADGTFLRFGPSINAVRLQRWLAALESEPMFEEYGTA